MMGFGPILFEDDVSNSIKLDDLLIWGYSYLDRFESVNLTVDLPDYFGFPINFLKSVIVPTRRTEKMRCVLDSKKAIFYVKLNVLNPSCTRGEGLG